MTNYRRIPSCLLFVTALFFAVATSARGDSIMPENKVPERVESKARLLTQALENQGFEVSRGYFKLYTIDDCAYTYPIMHTCYANNPAAPYVTLAVPPWPEEFTDDKSNIWGPSLDRYEDIFRFDPREAIVILGKPPPPAAYYGEQTYLFSGGAERFQDVQTPPLSLAGPLCTSVQENCLADNWDVAYQIYGPKPLDGEIYAVAGTLGTETGNATYVGFGINYAEIFLGVANLSEKDLKGTAKRYRGQVNNTGKFYLYYFARDCSGLEDLTDGNCFELTDAMIPSGGHFTLTVRDYIVPGTERGPDSSLILPSMVLRLQRP